MLSVLREATDDSTIKIVALTGSGDYFSSGNDLTNFLESEVIAFCCIMALIQPDIFGFLQDFIVV